MNVKILGYTCNRVQAVKTYREINPNCSLKDAVYIIDVGIGKKETFLNLRDFEIRKLVNAGFILDYIDKDEIKTLMNQLIQKFLSIGQSANAKKIIEIWLQIIKDEE
jgi:hypothetical protein